MTNEDLPAVVHALAGAKHPAFLPPPRLRSPYARARGADPEFVDDIEMPWSAEDLASLDAALQRLLAEDPDEYDQSAETLEDLGVRVVVLTVKPGHEDITYNLSIGQQLVACLGLRTWTTEGDWKIDVYFTSNGDRVACETSQIRHGLGVGPFLSSSFFPLEANLQRLHTGAAPLKIAFIFSLPFRLQ